MNVNPVAPKLSNNVNQYSPAPVVKTSPIRKQDMATTPTRIGFLKGVVTNRILMTIASEHVKIRLRKVLNVCLLLFISYYITP